MNRRNQRKNEKSMKSCGYYAMGQHLFALDQKHKNTPTQCNKGKIMKSCGYYGMGQHLLLKEKVIKWLRRAYLVGDHFLYCHDVSVWFRDDSVRRN